jgi:hypothetical protein
MGRAGITRYRWRFERGPATLEAIFIMGTGDEPWELLLGAIGTDFAITLLVQRGFLVEAELPNPDYRALCRALQLNFDQNNHFKPTDFFADLNRNIPQSVDLATGHVQPHHVLAYRKDVDEADKKFFCGWKDNTLTDEQVSEPNLKKTLEAFKQRIYEFCRRQNISSRWTADQRYAQDYSEPPSGTSTAVNDPQ